MYDRKGDCTKIIHTNFLHREDDESDTDITPDQESANADDTADLECQEEYPDVANQGESGKDIDEGESEEEIHVTGLEEVVTSVVKDLSIDYTDDEDEDDYEVSEPKPFAAAKRNPQNTSSHSLTKSRSPQVKKIKTKLCTNIVKIVGESVCLYKLDTARQNLKEHPTNDFYKSNYESLLAPVQTQILAHHNALKKQHKEWEKQYYLSHDCSEPSLQVIRRNKEQYSIYKNMLLCEELLKYWKITVHL